MDDVSVFSSQKREQIRGELVAAAKADSRIGVAAHLGSAALGLQDRWSDIDLALCLIPGADLEQVLVDWTTRLYRDYAAVANYDVKRGDILIVYSCSTTHCSSICRSGPPPNCVQSAQSSVSSLALLESRFLHLFLIQRT